MATLARPPKPPNSVLAQAKPAKIITDDILPSNFSINNCNDNNKSDNATGKNASSFDKLHYTGKTIESDDVIRQQNTFNSMRQAAIIQQQQQQAMVQRQMMQQQQHQVQQNQDHHNDNLGNYKLTKMVNNFNSSNCDTRKVNLNKLTNNTPATTTSATSTTTSSTNLFGNPTKQDSHQLTANTPSTMCYPRQNHLQLQKQRAIDVEDDIKRLAANVTSHQQQQQEHQQQNKQTLSNQSTLKASAPINSTTSIKNNTASKLITQKGVSSSQFACKTLQGSKFSATQKLALTAKRQPESQQARQQTTAVNFVTTTDSNAATSSKTSLSMLPHQHLADIQHSDKQQISTQSSVNSSTFSSSSFALASAKSMSSLLSSSTSLSSNPPHQMPTLKTLLAVQKQLQAQRQQLHASSHSQPNIKLGSQSLQQTQPPKHCEINEALNSTNDKPHQQKKLDQQTHQQPHHEHQGFHSRLSDSYDKELPPLPEGTSALTSDDSSELDTSTSSDESQPTSFESMVAGFDHRSMVESLKCNGFMASTDAAVVTSVSSEGLKAEEQNCQHQDFSLSTSALEKEESEIHYDTTDSEHSSPTNSLVSLPPPPPPLLTSSYSTSGCNTTTDTATKTSASNNSYLTRQKPPVSVKPQQIQQAEFSSVKSWQDINQAMQKQQIYHQQIDAKSKHQSNSLLPLPAANISKQTLHHPPQLHPLPPPLPPPPILSSIPHSSQRTPATVTSASALPVPPPKPVAVVSKVGGTLNDDRLSYAMSKETSVSLSQLASSRPPTQHDSQAPLPVPTSQQVTQQQLKQCHITTTASPSPSTTIDSTISCDSSPAALAIVNRDAAACFEKFTRGSSCLEQQQQNAQVNAQRQLKLQQLSSSSLSAATDMRPLPVPQHSQQLQQKPTNSKAMTTRQQLQATFDTSSRRFIEQFSKSLQKTSATPSQSMSQQTSCNGNNTLAANINTSVHLRYASASIANGLKVLPSSSQITTTTPPPPPSVAKFTPPHIASEVATAANANQFAQTTKTPATTCDTSTLATSDDAVSGDKFGLNSSNENVCSQPQLHHRPLSFSTAVSSSTFNSRQDAASRTSNWLCDAALATNHGRLITANKSLQSGFLLSLTGKTIGITNDDTEFRFPTPPPPPPHSSYESSTGELLDSTQPSITQQQKLSIADCQLQLPPPPPQLRLQQQPKPQGVTNSFANLTTNSLVQTQQRLFVDAPSLPPPQFDTRTTSAAPEAAALRYQQDAAKPLNLMGLQFAQAQSSRPGSLGNLAASMQMVVATSSTSPSASSSDGHSSSSLDGGCPSSNSSSSTSGVHSTTDSTSKVDDSLHFNYNQTHKQQQQMARHNSHLLQLNQHHHSQKKVSTLLTQSQFSAPTTQFYLADLKNSVKTNSSAETSLSLKQKPMYGLHLRHFYTGSVNNNGLSSSPTTTTTAVGVDDNGLELRHDNGTNNNDEDDDDDEDNNEDHGNKEDDTRFEKSKSLTEQSSSTKQLDESLLLKTIAKMLSRELALQQKYLPENPANSIGKQMRKHQQATNGKRKVKTRLSAELVGKLTSFLNGLSTCPSVANNSSESSFIVKDYEKLGAINDDDEYDLSNYYENEDEDGKEHIKQDNNDSLDDEDEDDDADEDEDRDDDDEDDDEDNDDDIDDDDDDNNYDDGSEQNLHPNIKTPKPAAVAAAKLTRQIRDLQATLAALKGLASESANVSLTACGDAADNSSQQHKQKLRKFRQVNVASKRWRQLQEAASAAVAAKNSGRSFGFGQLQQQESCNKHTSLNLDSQVQKSSSSAVIAATATCATNDKRNISGASCGGSQAGEAKHQHQHQNPNTDTNTNTKLTARDTPPPPPLPLLLPASRGDEAWPTSVGVLKRALKSPGGCCLQKSQQQVHATTKTTNTKKKSVKFSDKVELVACASEQHEELLPNPLLARVLRRAQQQQQQQQQLNRSQQQFWPAPPSTASASSTSSSPAM